eukprot:EG_transcript_11795
MGCASSVKSPVFVPAATRSTNSLSLPGPIDPPKDDGFLRTPVLNSARRSWERERGRASDNNSKVTDGTGPDATARRPSGPSDATTSQVGGNLNSLTFLTTPVRSVRDLMTNGTGDGTGRTDAPHREDRTQSIVATSEALTNQSASSYEVDDSLRPVALTTRTATSAQRLHAQIMGYVILTPAKYNQIVDWVVDVQEAASAAPQPLENPEEETTEVVPIHGECTVASETDHHHNHHLPNPMTPTMALTSFNLRSLQELQPPDTPLWTTRDIAPRHPSFNDSIQTFGNSTLNQSSGSFRVSGSRSMGVDGGLDVHRTRSGTMHRLSSPSASSHSPSPKKGLFINAPYLDQVPVPTPLRTSPL